MNATEDVTTARTPISPRRAHTARAARTARVASLAVASRLMDGVSYALRLVPPRYRYLPADVFTVPFSYVWRQRVIAANFAAVSHAPATDAGVRWLARESIRNYGRMAIDFLAARTMDPHAVARDFHAEGYEHYHDALNDQRGVIFTLPHAGSWDIAAVLAEAIGIKITVVTEGDWVTDLVSGSRLTHGVTLVPRTQSLRALFRALHRKEAVVLLSDLANSGVQTIDVPFFGRPAPFPDGPARLAYRTGAPLMVVSCVRLPDRAYVMEAQPPLRVDPALSEEENVHALTAAMAAGFERVIARYPEHWYPYHPVWPSG